MKRPDQNFIPRYTRSKQRFALLFVLLIAVPVQAKANKIPVCFALGILADFKHNISWKFASLGSLLRNFPELKTEYDFLNSFDSLRKGIVSGEGFRSFFKHWEGRKLDPQRDRKMDYGFDLQEDQFLDIWFHTGRNEAYEEKLRQGINQARASAAIDPHSIWEVTRAEKPDVEESDYRLTYDRLTVRVHASVPDSVRFLRNLIMNLKSNRILPH